ncbi:hypothetical protein DAPPUDRAFT_323396 [Daphnia pulex]|uniref:DNA topoisomerase 2 n=1 Tax=Daphnia pulex TaxID=6669 RepID=E9GYS0_DAPPU|nr:hypothetical protein DAPPUDRAFT_323396 [Daphnia pulex]|eukprot:EFX75209.1 hypothetical protein DAPPUDRAFT_323396 [Daphnia pulex]
MLSGSSRSSDATIDSASQARSAAAISAATTSSFANIGSNLPATPSSTGVPSLGNMTIDQQILSGIQSVIAKRTSKVEKMLSEPNSSMQSREPIEDVMWVYEDDCIFQRQVTYVPGLYQIFDELLVNAADNKIKDMSMDTIRVDIDLKSNIIKIFYNGEGIPVVEKEEAKMYVPSLIFCSLQPSFNICDEEEEVTGHRNCFGAKLANMFSTSFVLEIASKEQGQRFKQEWRTNMTKDKIPEILPYSGSSFTEITFSLDMEKFKMDALDRDILAVFSRRAVEMAACTRGVKVFLNGNLLPISNFTDYVNLCLRGEKDCFGRQLECVSEVISDSWEIAVASSNRFQQMSFANKYATTEGGRHVFHISNHVIEHFRRMLKEKVGTSLGKHTVRKHIWVFVNCSLKNSTFKSPAKAKLMDASLEMSMCTPSRAFFTKLNDCGVLERLILLMRQLGY